MGKGALVCLIVCMVVVSSLFAGCATVRKNESRGTEDLLIAAGFTKKFATTTEGQAKLNALKPLKMVRARKNGEVIYVYPDPYNCKCAYVGGEQQYAEYKRLAIRQQMGEQDSEALEWLDKPTMDPESWLW
ncbi:MAG: hypothetical protein ACXWMV_08305 [Syntrophales bacterium]